MKYEEELVVGGGVPSTFGICYERTNGKTVKPSLDGRDRQFRRMKKGRKRTCCRALDDVVTHVSRF